MEQLNCMTLQESTKRQRQRPAKNVSSQSSNSKGSHAERARFSIDMEAQHIAERWSNEALDIEHDDDTDVKLQHDHQWPQIKDVVDQHDFKEPQIHKEDIWYIGPCKRTDAEHALHLVNKVQNKKSVHIIYVYFEMSLFILGWRILVRDCSLCSSSEPFVLSVFHEKKVYNVKIRFLESHRKYALGRGQRCNEMFYSVSDIIKFHSIFPIVLISGKNLPGGAENCVLTFPVTKEDVERLLQ
ncbi:hypothetical protein NQD34_007957 [Periophthalmus magnuspinnatus]|nr:hypothetical protein NQD34_007957 [Periophthalmus magnuspinnatus]